MKKKVRIVINAGSSSLRAAAYCGEEELIRCYYDNLGKKTILIAENKKKKINLKLPIKNIQEGIKHFIDFILLAGVIKSLSEVEFVAHRVVHGGEYYKKAVVVDERVEEKIEALSILAPLHNPYNLAGIRSIRKIINAPNIAVFDTAYHQTIPEVAYRYGLPDEIYKKYKIRKYGFHGINHKYLASEAKKMGYDKVITCHLGNGSSITANENCKSIDTTMGFTPTDGLIMGTRVGAIDPEAIIYLLRMMHNSTRKLDEFLNKKSGLLGVSGLSSDIRELWKKAQRKNRKAILALEMLAYHLKESIGAYYALLNGPEAVIFSGGIGENAWYIRELALDSMESLGIKIDRRKNMAAHDKRERRVINSKKSRVKIIVIPSNEELQIIRDSEAALKNKTKSKSIRG